MISIMVNFQPSKMKLLRIIYSRFDHLITVFDDFRETSALEEQDARLWWFSCVFLIASYSHFPFMTFSVEITVLKRTQSVHKLYKMHGNDKK